MWCGYKTQGGKIGAQASWKVFLEDQLHYKRRLEMPLVRMLSPNFQKTRGIGAKATAMKPRSDVPHPTPRASYMLFPANGSSAPRRERETIAAAVAEAA
jgi:hypothetical protein